ncbi:hypothetical protein Tco_0167238 [Tanacetum coccineum]
MDGGDLSLVPAQSFLQLGALGAPAVVLSLAIQGVFCGFKDIKTPLFCLGEASTTAKRLHKCRGVENGFLLRKCNTMVINQLAGQLLFWEVAFVEISFGVQILEVQEIGSTRGASGEWECVLILLKQRQDLPKGGVYPPGIIFGPSDLQDRLQIKIEFLLI